MLTSATMLVARLLFAVMFAAAAIPKLGRDPEEKEAIAKLGLPMAGALEMLCGLCLAIGAAMLALGVWTRLAAGALAAFVVVVTPLFLRFWSADDPAARSQMTQAFFGNVAIVGGLLYVCAAGPGVYAVMAEG